jgi:4-hydroxy-tetrahydrodipicolinate synthase
MLAWGGVFPAVTSPFTRDLAIDFPVLERHLEVLIQSGVSGLVMLGSLGENTALTPEEKSEILRVALGVAAGRVPVVAGVAELNTAAAAETVRRHEHAGVQGAMVLPAMVYRADPAEARAHFRAVARATGLPIIAYNNPLAYPVDLSPEDFADLASEANIVAIKESTGDPRRITDLFNFVGDRYILFAGVDDLVLECALLGATGWIAGIGLAFPRENQRLWDLAMAGKWAEARELYRWFSPLAHLDVGPKFVQKIKLACQETGLGSEWVRLPRLPLAGEEREAVLRIIRHGLKNRPSPPA